MNSNHQRNGSIAAVGNFKEPIEGKRSLLSILGLMALTLVLVMVLIICIDFGITRRTRKRHAKRRKYPLDSYSQISSNYSDPWYESSMMDRKKRRKKLGKHRYKKNKDYQEMDQENWNGNYDNEEEEPEKDEAGEEAEEEEEDEGKKTAKAKSRMVNSRIASSLNALFKGILLQLTPGNQDPNKFMIYQEQQQQTPDQAITAPQIVLTPVLPQQFPLTPLTMPQQQQYQQQLQQTPQQQFLPQFQQPPQLAPQLSPPPPPPPPPPPSPPRVRQNPPKKKFWDPNKEPVSITEAPPIPLKQYEKPRTRKVASRVGELFEKSIFKKSKSPSPKTKKGQPFYALWKPGGSSIYGPDLSTQSDSSTIMASMDKSQVSAVSVGGSAKSDTTGAQPPFIRKFKKIKKW